MPSNIQVNGTDTDNIFILRDEFGVGIYKPPGAGSLWAFGSNINGQLGLNDNTANNRSSPTQVGTLTDWVFIHSGGYDSNSNVGLSLTIKTNGTLWSWGRNAQGQLGLNDILQRSSPTQVGTLANWKVVEGESFSSVLAKKTDGTLWAWGKNDYGSLGLGDAVTRSSPTQVGTLTNWKNISVGSSSFSAATKTDGTLWTWGRNYSGRLGLNDTSDRLSPTQVGTLTNWNIVKCSKFNTVPNSPAFMAAIKTNNELWMWGNNAYGSLGLNDTVSKSSPTQVGTLANWKEISLGVGHVLAIKTDGTLWAWGRNIAAPNTEGSGQLGLNDTVSKSSPTQVGSLTNWKQVSANGNSSATTKTDGTLWTWGNNISGQLGLGDNISRSSPTQVGSLTNWEKASIGPSHTLAIRS